MVGRKAGSSYKGNALNLVKLLSIKNFPEKNFFLKVLEVRNVKFIFFVVCLVIDVVAWLAEATC